MTIRVSKFQADYLRALARGAHAARSQRTEAVLERAGYIERNGSSVTLTTKGRAFVGADD